MANNENQGTVETLREDLNKLSAQIENIVKAVENRKDDVATDVLDKLSRELDRLRSGAHLRAREIYDAGHAGMDELGEQVRRNPMVSLLVAFGAGCVLSCLMRHLR